MEFHKTTVFPKKGTHFYKSIAAPLQTYCPDSWPPADKMTDDIQKICDLNKLEKVSLYALKTRPQSVFSSSSYISRGHIGMRGKCVGKVTAVPDVVGESQVEKQRMEALFSPTTLTPQSVSFSPSCLFSIFCTDLFHPLLHPHLLLFFFPSQFLSFLLLNPAICPPPPPPPVWSCVSHFDILIPYSSSRISLPMSLSLPLAFSSCLFGHGPISPIGLVAV